MSSGRVRRVVRLWRSALVLAALTYVVGLAASPLLHHDIACELKSRTHCTICVAGVAGPGLPQPAGPPVPEAPRAVAIATVSDTAIPAASFRSIKGRAPPAV